MPSPSSLDSMEHTRFSFGLRVSPFLFPPLLLHNPYRRPLPRSIFHLMHQLRYYLSPSHHHVRTSRDRESPRIYQNLPTKPQVGLSLLAAQLSLSVIPDRLSIPADKTSQSVAVHSIQPIKTSEQRRSERFRGDIPYPSLSMKSS